MKTCVSLFVIGCCLSMTVSCTHHSTATDPEKERIKLANDSIIKEAKGILRTGDLILRTGTDFSSEEVKDMSKSDKTYSHGGVVMVENDKYYVYHVEPDYYHMKDKVRKEELDTFWNPSHNYGFAIGRYNLSDEERNNFMNYLEEQRQKKIVFDMGFDLQSDDKMYCSEMIKKGLERSTHNRIIIETDRLTDRNKFKIIKLYSKLQEKQFANREIVPIDHLFLNPNCSILKRYIFLR